jgi:hypothetical protein
MTKAQTGTLVLKDATGSYFLVAQETLEQGRVPVERTAELEQMIAAAAQGDAGGDVQGYGGPLDTSVSRKNMSYTYVAYYLPLAPVRLP